MTLLIGFPPPCPAWVSMRISTGGPSGAWQACSRAANFLSIEQIAANCGFPNRFYFSRVFRQRMSCGPAENRWRQVR
jgi:AraC-like DNA-binding protein